MKRLSLLKSLSKSYISYLAKKEYCPYLPYKLWIETTSRCNLSCSACPNKDLGQKDRGDMDFALFKKIIDLSKDFVFEVNLFHRGEPLLHPEIIKMINYAALRNIKTCIHTNAVLLDSKMSQKIIGSDLSKIYFSLDTFIKSDYEKNRHGAVFDEVLSNIKGFLKIKKESGSKKPAAFILLMDLKNESLSSLDRKKNLEYFKSIIKDFRGLALDGIIKREAHNWGGSLKTAHPAENSNIITCTFPWYSLTVFFDGRVYLCPQDFKGLHQIGDINNKTIREIFNDEPIRYARKKLGSSDISGMSPCSKCDRLKRKTFAGIPAENMGQFLK
jgi:radical SAM protein with 4Fe4S-binding SPASM domain